MTLNELKQHTSVRHGRGYCLYEVEITYHGTIYKCTSNNSCAWDRLDDDNFPDNYTKYGYTNKGAWKAFYDECKRKNHLGEYSY